MAIAEGEGRTWPQHVRHMAEKLGLSYMCAISDKRVKDSYVPMPKARKPRKSRAKPPAPPAPPTTAEQATANRAAAAARVKAMKAKPKTPRPTAAQVKARRREQTDTVQSVYPYATPKRVSQATKKDLLAIFNMP